MDQSESMRKIMEDYDLDFKKKVIEILKLLDNINYRNEKEFSRIHSILMALGISMILVGIALIFNMVK